jgi:hypothetical protein
MHDTETNKYNSYAAKLNTSRRFSVYTRDFNSKLFPQESRAFPLRLEELDPNQDAEKFGFASGHRFSAGS